MKPLHDAMVTKFTPRPAPLIVTEMHIPAHWLQVNAVICREKGKRAEASAPARSLEVRFA
jgi:hypothetical protein